MAQDQQAPGVKRKPPLHNRHVMWLPKVGLAYFRVPKAANSSIRYRLVASYNLGNDDETLRPNKDRFWTKLPSDEATSLTLDDYANRPDTRSTWSFTMVRHPVTRLYSCWNNKVIENGNLSRDMQAMGIQVGMSFAEFVARVEATPDEDCDVHIRQQVCFLRHNGRLLPDFIGRLERGRQDWLHIRHETHMRTGRDIGSLPKRNVRLSQDITIDQIVPAELIARIETRYADDMALFYPGGLSRKLRLIVSPE